MKGSLFGNLVFLGVGLFFLCPVVFAQDVSSIVNVNNQFAFELYSKYKSTKGNIFFSPYSISSVMAMAYEGAKGKTADEIQAVFHFPKDEALRRESFLTVNKQFNKKDKKYELHTANALWAQKGYKFLDDYFKSIGEYYGGNVTSLDFVNEAEASRFTINSWVEKQTNDKIKDLIPEGALNSLIRLVLTNAVYFKADWANPFLEYATRDEDFRLTPAGSIKVKMMRSDIQAYYNYAETDRLQILELPYKENELSMLILLPKNDDLGTIEQSLDDKILLQLKSKLEPQKVMISLPKFKFEAKYFISEGLKEMGMPTAFIPAADFSGMTGRRDLYIDWIIHQAFVSVDEKGTEAAAATGMGARVTSAGERPKVVKIFKADHPFIFLIQENATGAILFAGRVSDPTK